ncbi:TetR family transcriptional regulator C-terminal domain-containing protein [Microbacterium sp. CIAB417]|uniref:TetR family transcriptional regulator C-terminal domain-containing protein n=1 Tax=Microbacterium sp. CIAB417 TaxID=2860287 RepID=UPI001FABE594|nr:TetR family transcriptional regulator [Microbacterium sp. CIAB417]
MSDSPVVDGRRARGDASRRSVLSRATHLASVEGLDGLTIGRLAETSGHSKSSIATLFGSKQSLQVATVAAAREVFVATIIEPSRAEPRGLSRLVVLMRRALDYSRERTFEGGCFFAATSADIDSKPGPVRDALREALSEWYGYVAAQIRYAADAGELALAASDAEALAFHLIALDQEANNRSLLFEDDAPYALAVAGMRERLLAAGADARMLSPLTAPDAGTR